MDIDNQLDLIIKGYNNELTQPDSKVKMVNFSDERKQDGFIEKHDFAPQKEIKLQKLVRRLHFKLEHLCEKYLGEEACKRLPLCSAITLRNGDSLFEHIPYVVLGKSSQSDISTAIRLLKEDFASLYIVKEEDYMKVVCAFSDELRKACSYKLTRLPLKTKPVLRIRGQLRFSGNKVTVPEDKLKRIIDLFKQNNTGRFDEAYLNSCLYSMLLRYKTLGGAGLQASLPNSVFELIERDLHVDFEVFASPLNCRYKRFCSAFPDVDSPFGSVGSFFDFVPKEGSFEANPPFLSDVINKMFSHIENLLSRSKFPLSFICFVPARFIRGRSQVRKTYLRHLQIMDNRSHSYMKGNSPRKRRKVKSTCDTAVLLFQNPAGKEKWQLRESFGEELSACFR